MGWAGLGLALTGGLTVVFTFPSHPTGMAIGVVFFVVGMFAMRGNDKA